MSSQMINDVAMNPMMMNIDGLRLFVFIKRNAMCWLKNRNQLLILNIPGVVNWRIPAHVRSLLR